MYKNVEFKYDYREKDSRREVTPYVDEAEIISSELEDRRHAPALDLDVLFTVVPSSTIGHYHLYIDVPMTWRQYKKILKALADGGVIEKGYYEASIARKASHLRAPWVKKE